MKKKRTTFNLIKTSEQAEYALSLILEEKQMSELSHGIYLLIAQLKNSSVEDLMDQYPDLLQRNDFRELLSGEVKIPNTDTEDVITAGIMSYLLTLISFAAELQNDERTIISFEDTPENPSASNVIQYIVDCISFDDVLPQLFKIILSIVGVEYYEKFKEKINPKDFVVEDLLKFHDDPELNEHIDMMMWFALIRLFLESIYFKIKNDLM